MKGRDKEECGTGCYGVISWDRTLSIRSEKLKTVRGCLDLRLSRWIFERVCGMPGGGKVKLMVQVGLSRRRGTGRVEIVRFDGEKDGKFKGDLNYW